MREFGKEQHCSLILFETFPQVVGIGLGDAASLAILPGWNGREFFFAPGEDIAVAFLQILVFSPCEFLSFALCDDDAGLLEQSLHIGRPCVAVGIYDEGQLPQQVRTAQAVVAMIVGEIGGPSSRGL